MSWMPPGRGGRGDPGSRQLTFQVLPVMNNDAPEEIIGNGEEGFLEGVLTQRSNPNQDEINHQEQQAVLPFE